jgi:hypothetical protein
MLPGFLEDEQLVYDPYGRDVFASSMMVNY